MSFIPDDEFKGKATLNFAPMIDFLFLMVAFFACMAVTRDSTKDMEIDLVQLTDTPSVEAHDYKWITIQVNEEGSYKWVTDIRDYPLENASAIALELQKQHQRGLLPENKEETQVLLKIDKNARWDPIARALFAIKEAGFEVRPVYEPLL